MPQKRVLSHGDYLENSHTSNQQVQARLFGVLGAKASKAVLGTGQLSVGIVTFSNLIQSILKTPSRV